MIQLRRTGRGLPVAFALLAAGALIAGCTSSTKSTSTSASPTATGIKKGLPVYFIPKDTQNPYEVIADQGGQAALAELGGKVVVSSGTTATAAAQIPSHQASASTT